MKLHQLGYDENGNKVIERKSRKRVGRGTGSGLGKTAGKGHKGQNSRSGGGVRLGFEGGQNPIYRRLPKRGFTNFNRKKYVIIDLDLLNQFDEGTVVNAELLASHGVLRNKQLEQINRNKLGVKVLGTGDITKKLTVKANKFTKTAEEKITANGGVTEVI